MPIDLDTTTYFSACSKIPNYGFESMSVFERNPCEVIVNVLRSTHTYKKNVGLMFIIYSHALIDGNSIIMEA